MHHFPPKENLTLQTFLVLLTKWFQFNLGAVVAALLPNIQAKNAGYIALAKVPIIKFLVLISEAKFEDIKLEKQELASTKSPIQCPSLHFIGEKDYFKKWGIALVESFVDSIIIHHPWGHTIPKLMKKAWRQHFPSFIKYRTWFLTNCGSSLPYRL